MVYQGNSPCLVPVSLKLPDLLFEYVGLIQELVTSANRKRKQHKKVNAKVKHLPNNYYYCSRTDSLLGLA